MFLVILWCKTSFLGIQIEHFETPKKRFYKVKSIKKEKKFSRKRKSWFVFVFFIHIFKRHKFFDKKHKIKGTTKKPKTGRVLRTRRTCWIFDEKIFFLKEKKRGKKLNFFCWFFEYDPIHNLKEIIKFSKKMCLQNNRWKRISSYFEIWKFLSNEKGHRLD